MEPVKAAQSEHPPIPWRGAADLADCQVDEILRAWLQDGGSLTRRLRRIGGRQFRLEVLAEGWEQAREEDMRMLSCTSGRVRVRRVRLSAPKVNPAGARFEKPRTVLRRIADEYVRVR